MSSSTPAPKAEPPRAAKAEPPEESPKGLSAFAAKVLDQLSLTAWLPAALVSATLALLLQFRSQESVNLQTALAAIRTNWVAVLLLAVPVLVLTTLTTQAFSFTAIQFLEGYGMRRWPLRWLRNLMMWRRVRRLKSLHERRRRYAARAFDRSEGEWTNEPAEIVLGLRAAAHELADVTLPTEEMSAHYAELDWRDMCDPWDLARWDDVRNAIDDYPARGRILPTKLGNVLRSTEDSVVAGTDEDLSTFAMRYRPLLDPLAQRQHDQFRDRLDMYCTLVFVCAGLAVAAPLLSYGRGSLRLPFVLFGVGFVILAMVSYSAAVASARGYCTQLRLMKQVASERLVSAPASETPPATVRALRRFGWGRS